MDLHRAGLIIITKTQWKLSKAQCYSNLVWQTNLTTNQRLTWTIWIVFRALTASLSPVFSFVVFYLLLLYLSLQHLLSSPSFPSTFSPVSPYLDSHGNTDIHTDPYTSAHARNLFLITPDLWTCNDTAATLISQSARGATRVLSGAATGLITCSDRPVLMYFLFWYASSFFFLFSPPAGPHIPQSEGGGQGQRRDVYVHVHVGVSVLFFVQGSSCVCVW